MKPKHFIKNVWAIFCQKVNVKRYTNFFIALSIPSNKSTRLISVYITLYQRQKIDIRSKTTFFKKISRWWSFKIAKGEQWIKCNLTNKYNNKWIIGKKTYNLVCDVLLTTTAVPFWSTLWSKPKKAATRCTNIRLYELIAGNFWELRLK